MYERCFIKERICFVTYGDRTSMDWTAASIFCDVLLESHLPFLVNESRLLLFDEFLRNARSLIANKTVWLGLYDDPIEEWMWAFPLSEKVRFHNLLTYESNLTYMLGATVKYDVNTDKGSKWIARSAYERHIPVCEYEYVFEPCKTSPCLNNGICYPAPETQSYTCTCTNKAFAGVNCSIELAKFVSEPMYKRCFKNEGICWVTYGDRISMDQEAARHFCRNLPFFSDGHLATPSDEHKLQLFDQFLQNARRLITNKAVWLDIDWSYKKKVWFWKSLNKSVVFENFDPSVAFDKSVNLSATIEYDMNTYKGKKWFARPKSEKHIPVCEYRFNPCDPSPCLNGGTCQPRPNFGFSCTCSPRYKGIYCEYERERDFCYGVRCHYLGRCVNDYARNTYKCICRGHFSGRNCEIGNPYPCLSNPCKNGATCISGVFAYRCHCAPGYEGADCGSDVNECADNFGQCHIYAYCHNLPGSYYCKCQTGFSGDGFTCRDIDECQSGNPPSCPTDTECFNTVGSYRCECKLGFRTNFATGTCDDIYECDLWLYALRCSKYADCINTRGSFRCTCKAGYTDVKGDGTVCKKSKAAEVPSSPPECKCGYMPSGSGCVDINECDKKYQNAGLCDKNADCVNGNGTYECRCKVGFTGDGVFCNDYDECAGTAHGCDPTLATCVNTYGSYKCVCARGYRHVAGGCREVDECRETLDKGGCSELAHCKNTPGSYECTCRHGTTGDGFHCEDIDECDDPQLNTCPQFADCHNFLGGYRCECWFGYEEKHVQQAMVCEDIDECAIGIVSCHNFAVCTNLPGWYNCECRQPFFTGDGYNCADVNECDLNDTCHVQADCENFVGGFTCKCRKGYTGDGFNCTDIDECLIDYGGCSAHSSCINTQGDYNCTCLDGFEGDGVSCFDVNECSDPTLNNCSADSRCRNYDGGFFCECPEGYIYTGFNCADIDECTSSTYALCHPNAHCHNSEGSFYCKCKAGYTGNGLICLDINECKVEGSKACAANAFCLNTIGDFTCSCRPGFTGDGYRHCTEIDECASNPCRYNGTCIDELNRFDCVCIESRAGPRCEVKKACNADELMERCFRLFYYHVNMQTFVINASAEWYQTECSRTIDEVRRCIKDMNCVVPNRLRGLLPARLFFCTKEYQPYPNHAKCLDRVNKQLDCFGVYPQMIPLALYWTFLMSMPAQWLHEVYFVINQVHTLFYSLSKHLTNSRQHECRRRMILRECGWAAAEWQFKFSSLLSITVPRILEVAYHRDTDAILYLDAAQKARLGTWLREVADDIRMCTPVLDALSASTQYGVIAVSDEDHQRICQMSPYEYDHICASMVILECSRIDAFVVGSLIPIHELICGKYKEEFVRHKLCLREAGSTPKLVNCSRNVTVAWQRIYNYGNTTALNIRVAAACSSMLAYLECVEGVVKEQCGVETAAWQRNATLMIFRETDYDKYCTSIHDDADPDPSDDADNQQQVSSAPRFRCDTCLAFITFILFMRY